MHSQADLISGKVRSARSLGLGTMEKESEIETHRLP
jgi:hypothetical protein